MNKLSEDVLEKIYKYKHEIEFKDVLNELVQHKLNCRFNVTISMLTYMFYLNKEGYRVPSINVSDLDVFSYEILDRIKGKKYYNII